ncbi:MAG: PqqD family protein [Actinomycetota bacterium]|nr:PqqD family protein [Actinomycetota bacterium]
MNTTYLTPDAVLRRLPSPRVSWVEVDGEAVAYDAENDALHLLDPIASIIWGLIDGKTTLHQTSDDLAGAFGQDPHRILDDVMALGEHLTSVGLAERVS